MNPLKIACLLSCLMTIGYALPNQSRGRGDNLVSQALKPTQWLSVKDLESIPSVDEITVEHLESLPLEKGAELLQRLYHLSQINHDLEPSYVPNNIQAYLMKPNGQKIQATLGEMVEKIKEQSRFGDDEVTIFITGLPQNTATVKKATRKLVEAYMQRYNPTKQMLQAEKYKFDEDKEEKRTSSEEDYEEMAKMANECKGDLIIVDLGSSISNFKRYAMLDIEQTGAKLGKWIVQMTNELDMPHETIHIVAQGIAAHVAGAAANEFTRLTGHKLRRITALDPSMILGKEPKALVGLSRGDADFVDAIHTSVYGMGTPMRVGNVDFYPNGPGKGVPGAANVVEASMRATRYFAESVRPGNERNFPAVAANSLNEYKRNNGFGKRTYMGIDTDYDLEGDYILEVNERSPFGKNAPAQKQNSYHGVHSTWKQDKQDTRDFE